MNRKLKMTRSQFVFLLVGLILMALIASGWSEFVETGEFVLILICMVAYAGIFPFLLGIAIQAVFRKKLIPSYLAWILAFVSVVLQWVFVRKTSIKVLDQDMISLMVSFLMIGLFLDSGFQTCRAFMEGRKAKQRVS